MSVGPDVATGDIPAPQLRRPLKTVWRIVKSQPRATVGLIIVVFFVLVALTAPWLAPYVRRLVGTWPTGFAAEIAAAIVAELDRRASLQDLGELSGREQEVWRFLSTSLSMQEIADALYVSRNTLKSHVRSIYRKLGVSTREAAVGRGNGMQRADA